MATRPLPLSAMDMGGVVPEEDRYLAEKWRLAEIGSNLFLFVFRFIEQFLILCIFFSRGPVYESGQCFRLNCTAYAGPPPSCGIAADGDLPGAPRCRTGGAEGPPGHRQRLRHVSLAANPWGGHEPSESERTTHSRCSPRLAPQGRNVSLEKPGVFRKSKSKTMNNFTI